MGENKSGKSNDSPGIPDWDDIMNPQPRSPRGTKKTDRSKIKTGKINDSLTISDDDLEIQVTHSDFIGQLKPPSSLVILNDGLQIQVQRQVWWFARYVYWPVQNIQFR